MLGSSPGGMGTGSLHRGPGYNDVEAGRRGGWKKGLTVGSYPVILMLVVL